MGAEIVRRPDCEKQLVDVVDEHDAEFRYGKNDCCLFALDVVYAITGRHLEHSYNWSSCREAITILNKTGGVIDIVDSMLFRTDRIMRGDIVSINEHGKDCLGVCMGSVSAFVAPHGIVYKKVPANCIAWRVE
jgi:hypothetical protein